MGMEKRGLGVTVILILGAAFMFSMFGQSELTGNPTYVRSAYIDEGEGRYYKGESVRVGKDIESYPQKFQQYRQGETWFNLEPDRFADVLTCNCPRGAVPSDKVYACYGRDYGDNCGCTMIVEMDNIRYGPESGQRGYGGGTLHKLGTCA